MLTSRTETPENSPCKPAKIVSIVGGRGFFPESVRRLDPPGRVAERHWSALRVQFGWVWKLPNKGSFWRNGGPLAGRAGAFSPGSSEEVAPCLPNTGRIRR